MEKEKNKKIKILFTSSFSSLEGGGQRSLFLILKYLNRNKFLPYLAVPQSVASALNLTKLHAIPDEEISLTVDVTPVWKQKRTAMDCHRTQVGDSPILFAPEEKQRVFFGKEHFVRVCARDGDDFLCA